MSNFHTFSDDHFYFAELPLGSISIYKGRLEIKRLHHTRTVYYKRLPSKIDTKEYPEVRQHYENRPDGRLYCYLGHAVKRSRK